MRRLLILLPLTALLSACLDMADGPRRQSVHRSAARLPSHPEARQCLAGLGARRANFSPLPDRYYGAGCWQRNVVLLSSVGGDEGALGVSGLGAVTCPLADTFAAWARYGVDRAAQQILGSELVRIETIGSYNCRNVAGSNKRSAHSTANAIDVSGFVLADGRRVSVLGDWTSGSPAERQFLRVVHASACKRFGTVLGPRYNPAHRDHFHLERSKGEFCG